MKHSVCVIVPCRNERAHIQACCASIAAQVLPPDWRLEVWIADGGSDDGTRELLQAWCEGDARFHWLDNPKRIVSTGLNLCIAQSQGEFIVRMDVHTRYAPDYVAQCIATWQQTGADNVGGPWRAEALDGPAAHVQQAIAAAFQSRWVSGGARSRDLGYEGEVDTVYLGAWPRQTFARFGGFDEVLVRNQDDEHNLRIHKGGGRVWQSPRIVSTYVPRASTGDVFRQYRQYGYWKPFVMHKHGQVAAVRHLLPALFVGALALAAVVALLATAVALSLPHAHPWRLLTLDLSLAAVWLMLALVLAYGAAVLLLCSLIAKGAGKQIWRHLPDVIAAYHFGYGLGSLQGWWDVMARGHPDAAFGRLTR